MKKTIYEKLESNTFYSPDGCWIWTGAVFFDNGYGRIVHNFIRGVHRVSYTLFKGPILPGKIVCHTCDNPLCYNPDHLWLGTHKDNAIDRNKKGRSGNKKIRVSAFEVPVIREAAAAGFMQKDIAAYFGYGKTTITAIVNRKSWAYVPDYKPAQI